MQLLEEYMPNDEADLSDIPFNWNVTFKGPVSREEALKMPGTMALARLSTGPKLPAIASRSKELPIHLL